MYQTEKSNITNVLTLPKLIKFTGFQCHFKTLEWLKISFRKLWITAKH